MKLDYLYGTELKIEQPQDMYHMNSDTDLLGHFMTVTARDTVLDIGTNTGALLLYASQFHPASLTGVDLYEQQLNAAERNMELNHTHAEFIKTRIQDYKPDCRFTVIICNPPYFRTSEDRLKSTNRNILAARHEEFLPLNDLCQSIGRLLADNGRAFIVYRPARMIELFENTKEYGLYPSRLRIAYESRNKDAKAILVEITKNKSRTLFIERPIFKDERETIMNDEVRL